MLNASSTSGGVTVNQNYWFEVAAGVGFKLVERRAIDERSTNDGSGSGAMRPLNLLVAIPCPQVSFR
jgi:hypothetical protein